MTFKFIDLFCGIGGFHIALKSFGGECVFASDIDKECQKTYKENFNIEPEGDITNIDENNIPDHDILVGGFPCQAMSNAGHKKAFDDKRGKLFDEIIRIAKTKKPKILILENVKHIKKVKDSNVYKYIYSELNKINYNVQDFEFSPHEFGIPQLRKRVYFICLNKDYFENIKINIASPNYMSVNIFENYNKIDKKYLLKEEIINVINIWNEILEKLDVGQSIGVPILLEEFNKIYENMDDISDWKKTYIIKNKELYKKYKPLWDEWYNKHHDLLNKKIVYSKLEWQSGPLKGKDNIWDHFIQIRQSGIRVKKSDNFPTLVAMVQVPIYGKEKRYLTPRECARLQSFPEDFKINNNDKIAYKQFGNSVNVKIVKHILKNIFEQIKI